jgi:signal transduction histidine kinase
MDKRILVFIFFFFLPFANVFSQTVIVNQEKKMVNVGKNMFVYEDNTLKLTIKEVNTLSFQKYFVPTQADVPALATTTAAVWVKFTVQNLTKQQCFLQLTNPTIDSISFYAFDNQNQLLKAKEVGTIDYCEPRELHATSFVIALPADTREVYLRLLDDETLTLDLKVGDLQALYEYNDQRVWWNAVYFGIVFIMLFYNFFLFLTTRDISYLHYVGFSFAFVLSFSHTQGFSNYILGDFDWLLRRYSFLLGATSVAVGSTFALTFLQMDKFYTWTRKLVYGVVSWNILNIIIGFLGYPHLSFLSMQVSALLPIYLYLILAFLIYRKGYKPALYYFIAFLGFELGLTAHILFGKGIIPYFAPIVDYFLHIGSAWELVILSFALAYKINVLKAEKEQAQTENLRLIRVQNIDLEDKVNERTLKLNNAIEELRVANEQMQALSEFKERLTGMIVHDLKNPLNTILGLGEKTEVVQAGKQMLNMVMNILYIQKFEKAKFELNLANIDVHRIVHQAIQEVDLLIQRKSLKVENKVVFASYARADAEIINRVLVNLLTNSIKYTPNNGKITISSSLPTVIAPDFVGIAVEDSGIGIPPEKLNSIFDKFSQIDARKSGIIPSTGLGLYFCKIAVEAHGGQIGVVSDLQKGSVFWVSLPKGEIVEGFDNQESMTENYIKLVLSEKEINLLKPYLTALKKFTVFEYSDVKNILDEINISKNEPMRIWKRQIENALRACNEEKYDELVNI